MKKSILILVLTMLLFISAFILSSCDSKNQNADQETKSTEKTITTEQPTEASPTNDILPETDSYTEPLATEAKDTENTMTAEQPTETPPTNETLPETNRYTEPLVIETKARIRDDMPEFTFILTGKVINNIDHPYFSTCSAEKFEVYDEKGSVLLIFDFILEFDAGTHIPAVFKDTLGLKLIDMNFDGNKDIMLLCATGVKANTLYRTWLWDDETSQLVYNESLSNISSTNIDIDNKQILRECYHGSDNYTYEMYSYINNDLVATDILEIRESLEELSDGTLRIRRTYTEEKLINGVMEIVNELTVFTANSHERVGEEAIYYDESGFWQCASLKWLSEDEKKIRGIQ